MNIQTEVIRLSIKFFTEIKEFGYDEQGKVKADEHYKLKIMDNIAEYLNGGMHPDELRWFMDRYKEQFPDYKQTYDIDEIIGFFGVQVEKKSLKKDPDNLLEPGRFYYHPLLQIAPPPPTLTQLPDGSFKASYEDEEFFLEIREKFTLDDLVDYFNQVMDRKNASFTRERDKGAFRHLLKRYDLDTILYTIDEARALAEDLNKSIPKNPLDIEDYIEDGAAILEERMNTCYMEGLDRVIPRSKQPLY